MTDIWSWAQKCKDTEFDYCKDLEKYKFHASVSYDLFETTSLDDNCKKYSSSGDCIQTKTIRGPFPVDSLKWTYKGKDKNMEFMTAKIDSYPAEQTFTIVAPVFKVGDKVSVNSPNWQFDLGTIVEVEANIRFYQTGKGSKVQRDVANWVYTVKSNGSNCNHKGIKESDIKINKEPDFNKYFNYLEKYTGLKFDRNRYTIHSFNQIANYDYSKTGVMASGIYYAPMNYSFAVTLCDKITGKKLNFNGQDDGCTKLSSISEKC